MGTLCCTSFLTESLFCRSFRRFLQPTCSKVGCIQRLGLVHTAKVLVRLQTTWRFGLKTAFSQKHHDISVSHQNRTPYSLWLNAKRNQPEPSADQICDPDCWFLQTTNTDVDKWWCRSSRETITTNFKALCALFSSVRRNRWLKIWFFPWVK